ncbi:MAG: Ig-like domain-containing protein [Treponema sp.]|nr:Ig-like domain-containing protein [Treponema sp.]
MFKKFLITVLAFVFVFSCSNPFFPGKYDSGNGGGSIELSIPNLEAGVEIGSVPEGEEPQPYEVTITNNTDYPTGELTITLSGEDEDKFTIEPDVLESIPPGESGSFTITPNPDLEEGEYTAAVTITDEDGNEIEFEIKFIVGAKTFTVTYDGNGSDTVLPTLNLPFFKQANKVV